MMRITNSWIAGGALVVWAVSFGAAVAAPAQKPAAQREAATAASNSPDERDLDAFIARNKLRQDADERNFNKRDAHLKRQVGGICSNC